jgi:hypothetical protein
MAKNLERGYNKSNSAAQNEKNISSIKRYCIFKWGEHE